MSRAERIATWRAIARSWALLGEDELATKYEKRAAEIEAADAQEFCNDVAKAFGVSIDRLEESRP